MSGARFPRKRDDGSLSVAARFSVSNPATCGRIEDYVTGWVHGVMIRSDLLEDLSTLPRVVTRGETLVDVVFDAEPGSRRWKDWMVCLARDLKSWNTSITFECFFDLVANAPHPASMRDHSPSNAAPAPGVGDSGD